LAEKIEKPTKNTCQNVTLMERKMLSLGNRTVRIKYVIT